MWGSGSLEQPVEVVSVGSHTVQFRALLLCKLDLEVPWMGLQGRGGPEENPSRVQPRASWSPDPCVAWSSGLATLEPQGFHCECP